MPFAITLNTFACAILVLGGIVFCVHSYRENSMGGRRFVFRAAVTWTFGLSAWLALWGLYKAGIFKWGTETALAMRLSDLNTASCFLFYVILTRGQRHRVIDHVMDALPMLTLPTIATLFILAYDWWNPSQQVYGGLSLAYSMITPIIVGWAIRLRFVVSLPLAMGCLYSILQPVVYGALFSTPAHTAIGQVVTGGMFTGAVVTGSVVTGATVTEAAIAATIVLAIAKVAWGCSVFRALAREVKDTHSIVRKINVSLAPSRSQSILVLVQLSLGLLLLLGYSISLREESRNVLTSVAELVGVGVGVVTVVYLILAHHKSEIPHEPGEIKTEQARQEVKRKHKRPKKLKRSRG